MVAPNYAARYRAAKVLNEHDVVARWTALIFKDAISKFEDRLKDFTLAELLPRVRDLDEQEYIWIMASLLGGGSEQV